jgi:hypothetical protein
MLVALFNPVISSSEKPDDANDAAGLRWSSAGLHGASSVQDGSKIRNLRRTWPHQIRGIRSGTGCFHQARFGNFTEQIGDEPTKVLLVFNSPIYHEINISTWLAESRLSAGR